MPDGGARSATLERMSALSLRRGVREQISSRTTNEAVRGRHLQAGGVSPLSLLTFFAYFLCLLSLLTFFAYFSLLTFLCGGKEK
jgi:hypothetical protein